MIADVLANLTVTVAIMLTSGFLVLRFYKKEKRAAIIEIEELIHEKLQGVLDSLGEVFEGIFTQPTVKKAFSIIGSQGGNAKSQNIAVDEMAKDVLEGPQFAAIKMGASAIGIDLDEYIDKHGAANTISAAQQLAQVMGIDIMNIDLGNLALPGNTGTSDNPYLRR